MNLIAKYTKKAVTIEAIQFADDADTISNIHGFLGSETTVVSYENPTAPVLKIPTLEGVMTAQVGDWIIKGVAGEFYPCKPDIFEATYEREKGTPPDARTGHNFGYAIAALKNGHRVARAGWNGKGMFVYYVPASAYPAQTGVAKSYFGEDALVPYNAYLAIKNVGETVSTWVPSVNDVLSEDWEILD